MFRRLIFVTFVLVALVGPGGTTSTGAQITPADDSPAATVRNLYKRHGLKGQSPFFYKKGRKYLDQFFEPALAGLIWKNTVETPPGQMSKLDFDPLYDTQDPVITNFRIDEPQIEGERATVLVTFNNAGRRTKITFRLRKISEGWRIENLLYGGGEDLVKILSEPL